MLELSLRSETPQSIRSQDIAKNQNIPEKFLELILVELRRAGLISSQRGPIGGHKLARRPEQITVGDVWRAIDGPLTKQGANTGYEPFIGVWQEVDRAISNVVDHITMAEMCKRAELRRSVPDFSI